MAEIAKSTLFIRSIPLNATEQQLQEYFGDIGPIRSCFIVKEKGDSNKSRGFGFVQFAIPEDAERARDHCTSTQFLNSNLQVEFAMHRQREANKRQHELIESEEKKPEPAKRRHVKPLWERVLLVSGLGEGLERKHLFKKLSKFGHVCAISFPAVLPVSSRIDIPGNLDMLAAEEKKNNKKMNMTELLRNNDVADCVELSDAAHVFFLNAQHAQTACEKLNNHIFKGQKLSAAICPNPIEAKLSSRIVLRNIPFDCPPSKIYKAFSKYGHIIEINLPKGKEDKGRGFGFLTFSSRQQAASAIESATKTDLGRTVVADWAVPKNEYASEKRVENLVGEVTEEVAEEANEGTIEEAVEDTIEETIEEAVEEPEDETESLEESSKEESALSSEDAVNEKNRVHNNVKQQRESDVSEGKTLFIKNIPFEATEEELIELFAKYGQINYCKIAVESDTGRSKGTGFIQFRDKATADAVLEESDKSAETFTEMIIESQNPLLSPESSSGFWLHGRHLSLMAAIKREDAESKKISDGRNAKILDKRNIYLIKEGFIRSDSNAAKLMPASELSKRHQSYYDRKRKLERFPHLFVSKTRLSIRNLPKSVDESALKELAKNAAHEWTSKMSEMAKAKSLGRSEKEEWEELVAGKIMGPVFVRQAKIIRDDSRVELKDDLNSSTPGGKKQLGQSKGYGFVEFSKHSHALAFLRQLNNNPSVFPNSRRLLIEFAIENSNTLSKRHARFTKNRDDQKQKKPIVKDPVQPKKSDSQKVKKPLKHAEKIEKKSIAAPSSQGTVDKYRQKLKTTDNWLAAS